MAPNETYRKLILVTISFIYLNWSTNGHGNTSQYFYTNFGKIQIYEISHLGAETNNINT